MGGGVTVIQGQNSFQGQIMFYANNSFVHASILTKLRPRMDLRYGLPLPPGVLSEGWDRGNPRSKVITRSYYYFC